jgi:hypothetical protein
MFRSIDRGAEWPVARIVEMEKIMLGEKAATPGAHGPDYNAVLAAPIRRACMLSGLSRSAIYRAASAGHIRLLKNGRSSLVDMASVRAYLAELPVARITQQATKPSVNTPKN